MKSFKRKDLLVDHYVGCSPLARRECPHEAVWRPSTPYLCDLSLQVSFTFGAFDLKYIWRCTDLTEPVTTVNVSLIWLYIRLRARWKQKCLINCSATSAAGEHHLQKMVLHWSKDGAAWPLGAGRAQGTCLFGVQYSAPSEKLACELIWE